jgi:excisionase family DNA binding protein
MILVICRVHWARLLASMDDEDLMLNHTTTASGRPLRMLSVPEAANELGISRSLTYELLSSGALRSVKIGRRRLVPREAIEAYIASLPAARRAS